MFYYSQDAKYAVFETGVKKLLGRYTFAGADPAFVIRDGPNSEHFMSNLWKLLKIGKFFLLTTLSLIVKRN